MNLNDENNWFLNISEKKYDKKSLKTPIYLTENIEYLHYMTKEGKYENSRGYNEFYIHQVEVDPESHIFGLQDDTENDDMEALQDYFHEHNITEFKSSPMWGKKYTILEVMEILADKKQWYITESPMMKPFYKQFGYTGFVTHENAGYSNGFDNLCILDKSKILSIEPVKIEDPEEWDLDPRLTESTIDDISYEDFKLFEVSNPALAREMARIAHDDEGQVRRATGERYWVHTETVADVVRSYGGNDDQISAAELHDTLEDTKLPVETMIDSFGVNVTNLVLELTNDTKIIKKIGKETYMNDKLVNLSNEALLIKLADFYHNLSSQPGEKQLDRMVKNIQFLKTHRKLRGNVKEMFNAVVSLIEMKFGKLNNKDK
jgi:hypothetical protein